MNLPLTIMWYLQHIWTTDVIVYHEATDNGPEWLVTSWLIHFIATHTHMELKGVVSSSSFPTTLTHWKPKVVKMPTFSSLTTKLASWQLSVIRVTETHRLVVRVGCGASFLGWKFHPFSLLKSLLGCGKFYNAGHSRYLAVILIFLRNSQKASHISLVRAICDVFCKFKVWPICSAVCSIGL